MVAPVQRTEYPGARDLARFVVAVHLAPIVAELEHRHQLRRLQRRAFVQRGRAIQRIRTTVLSVAFFAMLTAVPFLI